jgi:translation initiation factor IF-3
LKRYWRINQNIQAKEVRVIDSSGKQLGIFSLSEAQELARRNGTDLVEIAPQANPPVVKLVDFTKFRYQQEKKERETRKKEKKGAEQKEIWLTPFISDNDYQVRLERIREFLQGGSKVRTVIKFKGAQMERKSFGYDLAKRIVEDVKGEGEIESEPKFLGRQLVMILSPVKAKNNEKNQV